VTSCKSVSCVRGAGTNERFNGLYPSARLVSSSSVCSWRVVISVVKKVSRSREVTQGNVRMPLFSLCPARTDVLNTLRCSGEQPSFLLLMCTLGLGWLSRHMDGLEDRRSNPDEGKISLCSTTVRRALGPKKPPVPRVPWDPNPRIQ
jgi:hypothetical protein